MDKFLTKPDWKEAVPIQRKAVKRKFKENFVEYGFIVYKSEDCQVPFCLLCNSTFSNEFLVPNKLKRHLESNPTLKDKPREYFEKLATEKNRQSKRIQTFRKFLGKV